MLKKNKSKNSVASNRSNGFKWLLVLLAGLPTIIIALWFYLGVRPQLNRIENVANETKKLNDNFIEEIEKIETIGSPVYGGMIILTKDDMKSLKKILFTLKSEVDNAIALSHQDTINIVDRVNLYVTIGIVLLTLFGIFVPVIVQNFGSQELREKQRELNQKIKEIDDEVMNIPPLRLSYSLLRALDKDLIRWYSKKQKDNRDFLKGIFELIYKDLEICREKKVLSSRNKDILKGSLRDFNFHLKDILITFDEREYLMHFKRLQSTIKKFIDNQDSNKDEKLFDQVIDIVYYTAYS